MNPTTLKERYGLLREEALFEEESNKKQEVLSDEDLKIESLKIATNIAKLMSNVTPEDIVNVAETVAKFIKGDDMSGSLNIESGPESTAEEGEEAEDFADDEEVNDNENFEV